MIDIKYKERLYNSIVKQRILLDGEIENLIDKTPKIVYVGNSQFESMDTNANNWTYNKTDVMTYLDNTIKDYIYKEEKMHHEITNWYYNNKKNNG